MLHSKGGIYRRYIKRPMDFLLSLTALVILSPILLLIAILIKLNLGSPVIFRQKRPGLNEEIFTLYKFRTMTNSRNENGELLPDDIRITKLGKFLRDTSLDELPELINILKGDLSIVGPRPQLVQDIVFMTLKQRKRCEVTPGLTGWAQIHGRNSVTWEEKLEMDLEYIDNITFIKDWKIIFLTVIKVLEREGVSEEGMITAENLGDYLLRIGQIDEKTYLALIEKSREIENIL
ncbi:sugar transferase [Peribacillus faecalis]|uniref:sugar transferase n=1 Tax=Peribacillus faecalis TaxID=2772559 RepID=UPI0019D712B9|nr:sugar transferase [Peribacillus faecalis]